MLEVDSVKQEAPPDSHSTGEPLPLPTPHSSSPRPQICGAPSSGVAEEVEKVEEEEEEEEEMKECQGNAKAEQQQRRSLNQGQPRSRHKSKGKLVRSLAMCDESSLPIPTDGAEDNQGSIQLQITTLPCFHDDVKPDHEDPDKDQDQDRHKETDKSNHKPKIRMLSKDHSQEYTDSTGIDLHDFLVNTLQNNPRDRMMLLKLEQEIIDFITDKNNPFKKFPQMSSYHRMLVHRVAAYFGMDHNVDQTGKAIIINKTSNTRIPDQRFGELVKDEMGEESRKRFILKRDNSSIDKEDDQQHRMHPFRDNRRSKSMEEREEEYQRARERIFAQDSLCPQENVYIETRILEDCSLYSDTQKKRQLFRGNRDGSGRTSGSRQSSVELDSRWSEPSPWSSTDSDSSCPNYAKTSSLSGITVLTRGHSPAAKLSKTGSESSSSAGSSGALSRARLTLQPPNTGGSVPFPESQCPPSSPSYILVSLDTAGIPPGNILLNPHTGQSFVNPDGTPTIYNPPVGQQPIRSQLLGLTQQQGTLQSQPPQQQAPPPPQPPQQQAPPPPQPPQQQAPPPPQPPQQQMTGHMTPQGLQPSSQAVLYSPVSYPPQHLQPISPPQQFPVRDDMSAQFGQMSLSRQSSGEAPELPPSGPVYPPGLLSQPHQQPGFVVTLAGQKLDRDPFGGSGPSMCQPVLPSPGGFIQQTPSQVPVYYCSSGQYPTSSSQQYHAVASIQYSLHRNQQIPQSGVHTGYQPVLSSQQQGFQGLMGMQVSPQNQNFVSPNQQGSQVHGMIVPYSAMSTHQVPMSHAPQGAPYQQSIMLPSHSGQGALSGSGAPVYCSVMPPSPPAGLRLLGGPCPPGAVPVIQASCRSNCTNISNPGWQVKY